MKLAVALFLAFVAPTAAFVPSISCRGVVTASRTRYINALVSLICIAAGTRSPWLHLSRAEYSISRRRGKFYYAKEKRTC